MKILDWITGGTRETLPATTPTQPPEQKQTLTIDQILDYFDGGDATALVGAGITEKTAVQVAAVLACTRVLSEGIAQLPIGVYERLDEGGTRPRYGHHAHSLLQRPNSWQTSFEFRELMMTHAVLAGNAYAYKVRVGGKVEELIPLDMGMCRVEEKPGRGEPELRYYITDPHSNRVTVVPRDQILHLRGPQLGRISAMPIVRVAREVIGLANVTERSQASLHANGARPSGILSTDQKLSDAAIERLRQHWVKTHGRGGKGGTAVLDSGYQFTSIAMTGVDAQHLETRRFQVEEICRVFRVFPQMVMQADKATTYASAEQFFLNHVIHSLGPWVERVEQTFDRDLLDGARGPLIVKLDVNGLLRGAARDRGEFYKLMIEQGVYTRNEVRKMEGLNPLPGLDEPVVNTPAETEPANSEPAPEEGESDVDEA